MKKLLFIVLLFYLLWSCNNNPQTTGENDAPPADSTVATIQIPKSGCYLHVSGKDTLGLKIEVFPNVVTGVLRYDFAEKDRSKGEFDGKMSGDTLFAVYTFKSEGVTSKREVAFLLKDSAAIEGNGEMEEKDSVIVFKDRQHIDFSKGVSYQQISCTNYDPALTKE